MMSNSPEKPTNFLKFLKGSVNDVVMFSNGSLDFFYAAHNQVASTVMNMTFSLTDPFKARIR
jgi:hypothetical protein